VANGSEFVELDVVMTADLVPVLYHDFEVCAKQMKSGTESVKPQTLRIHNLTHHQLRHLYLEHTNVLKCGEEDKGCFTLCNNHPNTPKKNIFPTLAQVCHSLPKNVGFIVDVKYPTPNSDGQLEYSYFSRNQVADIIINTLYQHAGDRKIFLSCFDPDLCTMFRIKQPRYPVLYLTDTEEYPEESCADVRCRSLNAAISFALSESLLGVSAYCDMFLSKCRLVEAVHSRDLILFTWGEKNHFKESMELQRKAGVDAVINDRIPPEATPSPINISSGVEISFLADKEVELAWKERPLDFNTPSLSVIEVPVT
jgi:glycerophosphocholine phosphodiesterase GPCPD1